VTEAEIKAWLGFPADLPRTLRPEIVAGMASVPCPPAGPTDEHLAVFTAFLACAGRRGGTGLISWLFEPGLRPVCATCGQAGAGHQCAGPAVAWQGKDTS
jgi:hypothetical protein